MMTLDAAVQQPRTVIMDLRLHNRYKESCAKLHSTDCQPVEKAKLAFLDAYVVSVCSHFSVSMCSLHVPPLQGSCCQVSLCAFPLIWAHEISAVAL